MIKFLLLEFLGYMYHIDSRKRLKMLFTISNYRYFLLIFALTN